MSDCFNIEKSGFRHGEYVGYSAGTVWPIVKCAFGWRAISRDKVFDGVQILVAATLSDLSVRLSRVDQTFDQFYKNK